MKKKAIIFDLDGTIFDSEILCLKCWKKVGEAYGADGVLDVCMKCIGVNEQKAKDTFLEHYGKDFPYEWYREKARGIFRESVRRDGMPLKSGGREILQYLKDHGWLIGLASSTRTEIVTEELEQEKMLGYFNEILGGDMVSRSKPQPDLFLKACERLGCKPEEAYVIEDSFNGVKAAYNAKIDVIMVPDLIQPDEEIRAKCFAVLNSLNEVKEFLER